MSELVINEPLTVVFSPTPEVPNPSCCNIAKHLCPKCQAMARSPSSRQQQTDLFKTNRRELPAGHHHDDPYDGADTDDLLPLPITINSARADDTDNLYGCPVDDYLPLPRMEW